MAVASSLVRYWFRYPTRIVVIGLLLVLAIGSRFIYFSFPEDKPIQELNLMTANLAQQHRLKQNSQISEEASESLAVNNSKEKRTGEKDSNPVLSQLEYNILMTIVGAGQTSPLATRFKRCVLSICKHSSIKLYFHIITDTLGKGTCENTFNDAGKVCKSGLSVTYYDVDKVSKTVEPITKEIKVRD